MPRTAATPEQREHTRNKIRQAAAEVYRQKGLAGLTVRAIAERAGISTGMLYSYYANLEDLTRSLYTEPVDKANERLRAVAESHADPAERIEALLKSYVEFALENPDLYRGVFLTVRAAAQPKPEMHAIGDRNFSRLLLEAVREGQENGAVQTGNPEALVQVLWAGVHGALALPINISNMEFAPPEQLTAQMIDALMQSIRP